MQKLLITVLAALAFVSFAIAKQRQHQTDSRFITRESGLSLISDEKTGTILINAQLNGRSVVMILDTGASHTIFDAANFGVSPVELQAARMNNRGVGLDADVVWRVADFRMADQEWRQQPMEVADLSSLSKIFGKKIDGIVGQDVLRKFASVQINYKWHCVMLQQ
jgi:hypothetical protein